MAALAGCAAGGGGSISPGDRVETVRAQWGNPWAIERVVRADGEAEAWAYCDYDHDWKPVCDAAVIIVDGRVVEIRTYTAGWSAGDGGDR